uniref:DUF5641 domain-containing protein n=1 Tax=Anopheles dirus TaxID=7168 RepID=A0A182N8D2_9DIPT
MPPTTWPLARITRIHPGKDGIVWVVTITIASRKALEVICKPFQKQICEVWWIIR